MKVLINTPKPGLLGGVSLFYTTIKQYWSEDIRHNIVGKRRLKPENGKYWLPWDLFKFVIRLVTFRPDIVMVNPTLRHNAIRRDILFVRLALLFQRKVIVFFRGFDLEYDLNHQTDGLAQVLNRCDAVFVLAGLFRDRLRSWGVTTPIKLMTTKVDDSLLEGFDIERRTGRVRKLLFLSRVHRDKGIFTALEAFEALSRENKDLSLTIVGEGPDRDEAVKYCREHQLTAVRFEGYQRGEGIRKAYMEHDLYILPTLYEGMPNSVLEAMAFGLPVVTCPVGGIPDFFENGKMGALIEGQNPDAFAKAIETYIHDSRLTRETGRYNHEYACRNFLASQVARKIESSMREILEAAKPKP